jgi:hypothetical protein
MTLADANASTDTNKGRRKARLAGHKPPSGVRKKEGEKTEKKKKKGEEKKEKKNKKITLLWRRGMGFGPFL